MTGDVPSENEVVVAAGYDAVYAGAATSPTLKTIWQELASGPDYPAEFGNISFVTLAELRGLASELRLRPREVLVDLACGAGGPGLWVARETEARLIGIDLSHAGVQSATRRAQAVGLADVASFHVGSFADTGLEDASVHAAMSVDALQYAPSKAAAFAEASRILRPGGRLVFTAFEVDPSRVVGTPVLGDDPLSDYRSAVKDAGFVVESYSETPSWWDRMAASYQAVLDASDQLSNEMGPTAVAVLASEMSVTLELRPYRRRVLTVATRA